VVIEKCCNDLVALLTRAGDERANNGARLRLPVSIRIGGTRKWDARGHTGLKTGVGLLHLMMWS
jgi:hypothetical protein